ncbi:hypothetical protein F7Q99_21270 [Streptomyces kaniharaensis]|uniref:Relaxase/mobilization nuclease domain-containing protein n=1 Tax=Streptomyces kaniharaensis TaxID=212423 RepID=A0A6N7KXL3_9ACTN|nr:hypothetical protein [Streptomyces kaniharaensis]MQS14724.1 hypothetical protein [Streptomyces kaniharaensis]
MIAHLRRASNTAGLLTELYGPGERGTQSNARLVGGDCHGAPIGLLDRSGALPYLAQVLDEPLQRRGTRVPERPVWICSVRSDPRHGDLTDAQWGEVARRLAATSGIAPDGDPDACRWIAVRNEDRLVHVVATLVREDGRFHRTYRDAFHVQTECRRIAADLGHLPGAHLPAPRFPEISVPAPFITINIEPSGSVSAKGANDDLSATLLKHAGFTEISDWYGRRHRLPTTTAQNDRAAVATHAAEMLRAARYSVQLDPDLDASRLTPPTDPHGLQVVGGQVLRLTDQIRGAANARAAANALDQLLDPADGVLVRLQEALGAAAEQVGDLDGDAYELADRFTAASEQLTSVGEELDGAADEFRALDKSSQMRGGDYQAKVATFYATAVTSASRTADHMPSASNAARAASPAASARAVGQSPAGTTLTTAPATTPAAQRPVTR